LSFCKKKRKEKKEKKEEEESIDLFSTQNAEPEGKEEKK